MIKIDLDEIKRWRVEIEQAEEFKKKEFGSNKQDVKLAGNNISYYEKGYSSKFLNDHKFTEEYAAINAVYPIVKNVIPSLYYKNPYILALPKRKQDEDSAPYVSAILNYYFNELNIKETNKKVIFDAFVLGFGISKMGYQTKFGIAPTEKNVEKEKKDREKEKSRSFLEKIGLRKPKEEELPQNPELNEFIRSESPWVVHINPFNFGMDPTATSIYDAKYVYEKIRKKLADVKADPNYKNTKDLKGIDIEKDYAKQIPTTQIENFKEIELYEIHYKTDEGINILVLAKDGDTYEALRHDKSIYEVDGYCYEMLTFNQHGHSLYPISDIDVIKPLQDRLNTTFENVLDQIDTFVTKIAVNETKLTDAGKKALRDGQLGSIVAFKDDPGPAIKEIVLTQVKGDLMSVIERLIDVVSLETGITRAMLTGLTTAETATEAQIGQSGQNLRLSDKADNVSDFSNHQARKLWQIIRQFVDLEEIELITGDTAFDEITGVPRYKWLDEINADMTEKLSKGEYDLRIEVGSSQKPDLPILRKQIENLVNILGGKGVLEMFAMQGYKIELAEILRSYLQLFPDVFKNIGRIIKPISPGAQQPQPQLPGAMPPGAGTGGAGVAVRPQQLQSPPPVPADIISSLGGEKGQNIPIA